MTDPHNHVSAGSGDEPRDWFGDLNSRLAKGLLAPLEPPAENEPVAWLVTWTTKNNGPTASAYIRERDARDAARNVERYADASNVVVAPAYTATVAQSVGMSREKLAHTIAKQIACEEDCQKWPNGCGCALNAADAILASQPSPAATVETLNEQAREHPRYDNPRDPFASPDRLPPSSSAGNVGDLIKALEPFAEGADWYDATQNYLDDDAVVHKEKHGLGEMRINVGHLRAAKQALRTFNEPQAVPVQQAFEECAALMQRWSDDAAEFKDNERCQIQANVCRNAAVAIRNLSSRLSRPNSRSGPLGTLQACTCTRMIQEAHKPPCPLASQESR